MRRVFLLGLFSLLASSADAGMEDAKVALHVQAHTTKGICSNAPTIPCYRYITKGEVGV